jgi:hypothetical protein
VADEIAVILNLMGIAPTETRCTGTMGRQQSAVSVAVVSLRFAEDKGAHLFYTSAAPTLMRRLVISGDEKAVVFEAGADGRRLLLYDQPAIWRDGRPFFSHDAPQRIETEPGNSMQLQLREFIESIKSGRVISTEGLSGVAEVICGIEKSLENRGHPVAIGPG